VTSSCPRFIRISSSASTTRPSTTCSQDHASASPLAAKITADWCKRHGIEYLSVPYLHALVDSAKFMADAWARDASDPLEVRVGLVGAERAA
jgi:hypothetical protein